MKKHAGFTLLEVLISVAALTIIAGIGIPVYQSLQVRNDLDIAAETIAHSLRRAELLAQASDGDTSSGVKIELGNIILFRGTSYALRDQSLDEVFEMPTSLTPTGLSEIVCEKFTGLPTTTGTVTLTSNANEIRTITINAKGMVSY